MLILLAESSRPIISFISLFGAVGIVVCAVSMHLFLKEYREKILEFSAVSLVVRSLFYGAITILPAILLLWHLQIEFNIFELTNRELGIIDLFIAVLFFWMAFAHCYLLLLLSRAFNRSISQEDHNPNLTQTDQRR